MHSNVLEFGLNKQTDRHGNNIHTYIHFLNHTYKSISKLTRAEYRSK